MSFGHRGSVLVCWGRKPISSRLFLGNFKIPRDFLGDTTSSIFIRLSQMLSVNALWDCERGGGSVLVWDPLCLGKHWCAFLSTARMHSVTAQEHCARTCSGPGQLLCVVHQERGNWKVIEYPQGSGERPVDVAQFQAIKVIYCPVQRKIHFPRCVFGGLVCRSFFAVGRCFDNGVLPIWALRPKPNCYNAVFVSAFPFSSFPACVRLLLHHG